MSSTLQMICSKCGKSFEKASTYKRHGYYCRTKVDGQAISRKRSCAACARSKTRCDWKLPKCSHCLSRKLDCQYDGGAMRNICTKSSDSYGAMDAPQSKSSDLFVPPMNVDSEALLLSDHEHLTSTSPGWELDIRSGHDQIFLESDSFDSNMRLLHGKEALPDLPELIPRAEAIYPCGTSRQLSPFSLDLSLIIPEYLARDSTRPLVRRSTTKPLAQTSAEHLTTILGSFIPMMLRKETFPPFINPRCFSNIAGKEDELPEAIVNCMSLSRMFVERSPDTSKLFWRMVRMEHERLWLEYQSFDDWELLAAIQALLIYTIMRMVDGGTEYSDFDVPLLLSINATAQCLSERIGEGELKSEIAENLDEKQRWQEWVHNESRRRFVVVARVLDMLVDMSHALTCSPLPGFVLVPLPSKKVLWEAISEEGWKKEFESMLRAREIFGLTTEGQLVRLVQGMDGITANTAAWEEWYAGSDGFGSVVMLAASLIS